jgi:hypothetical protein
MTPRRTDGICPRCNTNLRAVRSSGKLRSWCGPCESKQKTQYMASDAGRATMRRYRERHGYVTGPPEVPCGWCGAPVYRREACGVGGKRFCDSECRRHGQNHEQSLRYARGKKRQVSTPIQITIEQILNDFPFEDHGVTEQQATDWRPVLAQQIALAVAQALADAINKAWFVDSL